MKWNNNQFRSIWMNGEHYMRIDQCDAIGLTTVRMLCYSNESERVSEWTSQKCLTQFRNRRKFWPRYRIESRWLNILYAFFTDIYQFDYNFTTFISFEKKNDLPLCVFFSSLVWIFLLNLIERYLNKYVRKFFNLLELHFLWNGSTFPSQCENELHLWNDMWHEIKLVLYMNIKRKW